MIIFNKIATTYPCGLAVTLTHRHNPKLLLPKPPSPQSTEVGTSSVGEDISSSHFNIPFSKPIILCFLIKLVQHHPQACRFPDPQTQSQAVVTKTPSSVADRTSNHEHR
jgi:hypothetical protein